MSGEIITVGETMGLFVRAVPGRPRLQDAFSLGIGGAESNVAIALARLGNRVRWIGRVGSDAFGALISRELRAEGVQADALVDPDAATGTMVKWHGIDGRTEVLYYRTGSAGSRLVTADIPDEVVGSARALHLTGVTMALSSSACEAVVHAASVAHAAGVPVSLDLNYRSRLWSIGEARGALTRVLRYVSIVFAGEDEATIVTGLPDASDAAATGAAMAQMGPSEVVIKRGRLGAVVWHAGRLHQRDAWDIEAIDTVGAGDAFAAGYLHERLAGNSPGEALETAVGCGALACLSTGDWEGSPTLAELAEFRLGGDPVRR